MKTVKCEICGKVFLTERPNKKYCSFTCKEAGRSIVQMKWKAAHKGYMTEYMREKRRTEKKDKMHG